jgi:microcystin-dependent protein
MAPELWAVHNQGGVPYVSGGPLGSRPAAGIYGRMYFSDEGGIYRDSGAEWVALTGDTAESIKAKLLTVDGPGSGLDSDTVDGSHASALATTAALSTGLAGKSDTTHNHDATYVNETDHTQAAHNALNITPGDGTITNAKVEASAAIAESKLNLASDAAAGTASRRSLGTGSTQAAAGNHTHTQLHDRNHNLFSTDHPDVDATDTPADGEVLTYNAGAGKWQSAAVGAAVSEITGAMKLWPGASPPAGYLLCDGAAVSRTTYSALYSALGGASSPWGQGDGSTTFNVPDMRGRAPIGAGQGTGLTNRALAATTGTETHTLTTGEMPAHTHSTGFTRVSTTAGGGSQDRLSAAGTDVNITSTSNGSGGAHQNMQPSVAINFIVKT